MKEKKIKSDKHTNKKCNRILKIMKISFLLFFCCFFTITAENIFSQQKELSLNLRNVTLKKAIWEIEKTSDYVFLITDEARQEMKKEVSIKTNKENIQTILEGIFNGTNLGYKIVERQVFVYKNRNIKPAEIDELIIIEPEQQKKTITGKITDESGQPIIGANIVEKGTTKGIVTDTDGNFSLNVAPNALLQISYIGYLPQEIPVTGKTSLRIILQEDTWALDEVVVVGYGVQKKINLTGAVDQVTSEVFEKRPITNITQGLVGVIPNLNINISDGKPTNSPSYNIRGTTSIGQGGSALILIDGVEGNPSMLNPNDIESISVLKDVASASIYGARAAFGVVLITTKAASKGKVSVTYGSIFSSKRPTTVPDNITESYPWAKNFNDSWVTYFDAGTTPSTIDLSMRFSQEYLAEIKRRWENPSLPREEVDPTTGEYIYFYSTDWYKELYKNNMFAQEHNIAVSGGGDVASFYVSGRYNGEDGLFRYNSDKYTMYNLRSKGVVNITNWLQLDNNTEYSKMNYHQPMAVADYSGTNIWRSMGDNNPPLGTMFNTDGTLTHSAAFTAGDLYLGKSYADIQRMMVKSRTGLKGEFFNKSLIVQMDFAYSNFNYSHKQVRNQVPYSRYKGVTSYAGTRTNDMEERRATTDYLTTNVYANYIKTFNEKHNFNLLAGFNYEESVWKNLTVIRNGIVFEDAKDIYLTVGENTLLAGGYEKWRIAGEFFRLNYNFDERYLLEINGRYDGSSKFPKNEQWVFFPSVSVGWRLSQEPFWKVSDKALSNLKIRASYGSLGNGSISPYAFNEQFRISKSGRILNGILPQKTSVPGVIPDKLVWETVTTGNIGFDIAALNNRLGLTGDAYIRWTDDMYTVGPSVPAIFGASVPKGNYGKMKTYGWEITLNWRNQFKLTGKPFNYDIKFTLADYKSKITEYYNPEMRLSDYYKGKIIGEIWGYKVDGLFMSQEDIDNSASQKNVPARNTRRNYVGDLKFSDLDGDNVIYHGLNRVGDSGDKVIIGNYAPRYIYGITLAADWNGFFLSSFFQGVGKQNWYPSNEARFWGQYNRPYNAYPRWHEKNMFRPELQNFNAYLPLLTGYQTQSSRALGPANDRFLQNVAYLRLKSAVIGYTIPKHISRKISANDLRIYASGENLLTWSPLYKWTKDIDVSNVFGSGSNATGEDFNSDNKRGDGNNYPLLKSISFGLSITF